MGRVSRTLHHLPKATHVPKASAASPQARTLFFCWLVVHLSQYHKGDLALLAPQILEQSLERGDAVDSYEMVALLSLSP